MFVFQNDNFDEMIQNWLSAELDFSFVDETLLVNADFDLPSTSFETLDAAIAAFAANIR